MFGSLGSISSAAIFRASFCQRHVIGAAAATDKVASFLLPFGTAGVFGGVFSFSVSGKGRTRQFDG